MGRLVHREVSQSFAIRHDLAGLFSRVPNLQASITLTIVMVDVWPTIQRLDGTLADYDYDYFPRGRVNWRKEDDRWLLVLDSKLNRATFIAYIVLAWKIPGN